MAFSEAAERHARLEIQDVLHDEWLNQVSENGLAWSEYFYIVVEALVDLYRDLVSHDKL